VAQIDRLAQTKTMPPMEDLNRFWFEMQREMTEGGRIARIQAKVTAPDGSQSTQTVTRVGPFVAAANGQFLEYTMGSAAFSTPPKQPPSKFGNIAEDFEGQTEGYRAMVVDPTRGVLLSLFSQRPSMVDRIVEGEAVNWIILGVGLIGALIAVYQFVYLTAVGAKINQQLRNLGQLNSNNPLGRVLLAFKGGTAPKATEDAEVVELRVSEAVLKELPPIERGQSFLKLAVAAGPLLGLVGTVVGMIHTFQVITESGSGDPKLMAAGISMAMIATLLGLGIAVPLLFANSALQSRSKRITQILDEQSTGLLAELLEKRAAHA
jgi:biopolymer transport protein ExbB